MNTYFKYSIVTGICALLCAPATQAQDEEQDGPWSAKAGLGYLATSGNTDTSSLNTSFEVGYKVGNWQHGLDGSAINSSENNVKTAGAYELGWKSARNLTEHDFLAGRINWREDQFGAYRTQLSETINYGRRIINSDAHRLNAEVGLGGRQSELRTGIEEEEFIVRGGLSYTWILSESAEFNQDFVVEAGDKNTYLESVTALRAKLVGSLALVASFTVKNNSDVPVATENMDTFTALSIEYTY